MLRLHELGWGSKRLSKEFGCARNTVRRYLREGGALPFKQPARRSAFDGLDDWLRERFFRHDGNADVIRQELASEHGIIIGLRSVELRVRQWRRELKAQKRATVRFEAAPGHQMQIDFGDTKVCIGDERVRIRQVCRFTCKSSRRCVHFLDHGHVLLCGLVHVIYRTVDLANTIGLFMRRRRNCIHMLVYRLH